MRSLCGCNCHDVRLMCRYGFLMLSINEFTGLIIYCDPGDGCAGGIRTGEQVSGCWCRCDKALDALTMGR